MNRPAISPSFKEGRYFDAWMLVHLASGIAGGYSNGYFGLSTAPLLALAFALMLLWEILEAATGVREALSNRVIDIVIGMAGVGLAVLTTPFLPGPGVLVAFLVSLGVALVGMGFGVRARNQRIRAGAPR